MKKLYKTITLILTFSYLHDNYTNSIIKTILTVVYEIIYSHSFAIINIYISERSQYDRT